MIRFACPKCSHKMGCRPDETGQTIPDQVCKPTARQTLRWLFQCFEGIDFHHSVHPAGMRTTEVLRLITVHRLVL